MLRFSHSYAAGAKRVGKNKTWMIPPVPADRPEKLLLRQPEID
jgi:hypothetical protein